MNHHFSNRESKTPVKNQVDILLVRGNAYDAECAIVWKGVRVE